MSQYPQTPQDPREQQFPQQQQPAGEQPRPAAVYPYAAAPQPVQPVPVYPGQQSPYYALVPMRDDPRRVYARKTVNVMCLLIVFQMALVFLLEPLLLLAAGLLHVDIRGDIMAIQWLSTAMTPLSTALPFFVYMLAKRREVNSYLRFEKVGFFPGLLCVLAGLAVCLLGNFPAGFVQDFFGNFGYTPAPDLTAGKESWPLLFLELFATAVVVPVMEEFAFRGVMFSALRKYGTGFAVMGSALIFSLVHLDFSNVLFAFIAGLVFGFLYAKTGNLWVTIFIHALVNGTAVFSGYCEFLFGPELGATVETFLMLIPVGLGLLSMVFLLIFRRKVFRKRDWNEGISPAPLRTGESAVCLVKAPLFWLVVGMMVFYTVTLFY